MDKKKRLKLQELLLRETSCGIQNNGWPCNSCFHAMELGVDDGKLHKLWLVTLRARGDYTNDEIPMTEAEISTSVDELIQLLE